MRVERYNTQKYVDQTESRDEPEAVIEDDGALWESFRNGSESAFVEIYNLYFQVLYEFGRQFSGDSFLVKDCIQEVFISIRIKRKRLPKVNSVKAYLLRSIRNKIITEVKRNRVNQHSDVDLMPLNFHVVQSSESILIKKQFNEDQLEKIRRSLAALTERQREAIYHFYYSNLGYEDIKAIMGFSSTRAARNLVYRALAEIKNTMISNK